MSRTQSYFRSSKRTPFKMRELVSRGNITEAQMPTEIGMSLLQPPPSEAGFFGETTIDDESILETENRLLKNRIHKKANEYIELIALYRAARASLEAALLKNQKVAADARGLVGSLMFDLIRSRSPGDHSAFVTQTVATNPVRAADVGHSIYLTLKRLHESQRKPKRVGNRRMNIPQEEYNRFNAWQMIALLAIEKDKYPMIDLEWEQKLAKLSSKLALSLIHI
eukprot:TRINITY_DN3836_c0_g1_i3.p1 TRINITY_DN3836_c0_g1~~TRINITY_DN3836_c0_g1_i3.p1  ORF type:complete len:224 (+),score=41.86 TRINITY_DN3836_c0_g1_i3:674-1345(+)